MVDAPVEAGADQAHRHRFVAADLGLEASDGFGFVGTLARDIGELPQGSGAADAAREVGGQGTHREAKPAARPIARLEVANAELLAARLAEFGRAHQPEEAFGRLRLAGEGDLQASRLAILVDARTGPIGCIGMQDTAVAGGDHDAAFDQIAGECGNAAVGRRLGADADVTRREAEQEEAADHAEHREDAEQDRVGGARRDIDQRPEAGSRQDRQNSEEQSRPRCRLRSCRAQRSFGAAHVGPDHADMHRLILKVMSQTQQANHRRVEHAYRHHLVPSVQSSPGMAASIPSTTR